MTEFKHSKVLFLGDDGLPIEFNIRNTVEKVPLKAMIEYGGGLCTLSDEAIHLVSPGTRVLNVDKEKKLISSRFIFDCVKENCLLEFDDYVIKITEVETSDISEEDSVGFMGKNAPITDENSKFHCKESENKSLLEPLNLNETTSRDNPEHDPDNCDLDMDDLNCNAEHIPDRLNSQNLLDKSITENRNLSSTDSDISKYLSPPKRVTITTDKTTIGEENLNRVHNISDLSDILDDAVAVIPETDSNHDASVLSIESNKSEIVDCSPSKKNNDRDTAKPNSPIHAVVVSSSQNLQQPVNGLDGFDNFLLSKLQENPDEQEDSLSQSYTVSSSADAQVSAKATPEDNSVEIFAAANTAAAPDSASQNSQPTERHSYIKTLEEEVERILHKPSPKSIQDKICLVKYICCVKKLPPAAVLQSLQNL